MDGYTYRDDRQVPGIHGETDEEEPAGRG